MTSAAGRPVPYAWFLVAVAWLVYGLGISPAYYSWGFFAPEINAELGLSRAQSGFVFTVFTFLYSVVSPLVGVAIDRFGLRRTIAAGALIAFAGILWLTRAETLAECVVAYGVLGGIGIGFSTILPAQTFAARWFVRYRARVLALVMTGGGVVGLAVPLVNRQVLDSSGWRAGWLWISGALLLVAVLALLFVRDSPQAVGLEPDGLRSSRFRDAGTVGESPPVSADEPDWNPWRAIRTWHFVLLTLCGIGFSGPWGVVIAHGRLHFDDLGLGTGAIAVLFSTMILLSTAGRLVGAFGDLLEPQRVLGLALGLEAVGLFILPIAEDQALAHLATILIAVGFGTAYVSTAVTFARFFGRRAFARTAGTRLAIGALVGPLLPTVAGRSYDVLGTYTPVWISMALFAAIVGALILVAQPPRPPVSAARG